MQFIFYQFIFCNNSHAYICLDIYPEIVGVTDIEVLFIPQVFVLTLSIIKITEGTSWVK